MSEFETAGRGARVLYTTELQSDIQISAEIGFFFLVFLLFNHISTFLLILRDVAFRTIRRN